MLKSSLYAPQLSISVFEGPILLVKEVLEVLVREAVLNFNRNNTVSAKVHVVRHTVCDPLNVLPVWFTAAHCALETVSKSLLSLWSCFVEVLVALPLNKQSFHHWPASYKTTYPSDRI